MRTAGESSRIAFIHAADLARADQTHHAGVPQIGILVAVCAANREERLDRLRPAELAERDRGEEPNPRARVGEQFDQAWKRFGLSRASPRTLAAWARTSGSESVEQRLEDGHRLRRFPSRIRPRHLTQAPDGVNARQRRAFRAWRSLASACHAAPPRAASSNCASWRTRMSAWASSLQRAHRDRDAPSPAPESPSLRERPGRRVATRRARGRSALSSACPSLRPSRRNRAHRRGRSRRRSPAPTRRTAWNRPA